MATYGASQDNDGIHALIESSPDPEVHTSAAAEAGFLLGLAAVLSAPFSVMHSVTLGLGLVSVVLALVGLVTTSQLNVAGKALVPLALVFALPALFLVALRYLGADTAFGDGLLPTLDGWLETLNARFGPTG